MRSRLRATVRLWWRMMRQQRVTRDGWFYVAFTLVAGLAAINTGNNLLYLVLGLLLSLVLLSAVLSEAALRGVSVERTLPRDAVAGEPFEVILTARNHKRRFPSFSLVLAELEGPAAGVRTLVVKVPAQGAARTRYQLVIPRRGVVALEGVLVSTRFPFGLFEKSRELTLPAELPVHPPRGPVRRAKRSAQAGEGERPEPRPGQGSGFHALREIRPGDDPRSVHWPSTARAGRVLVIERERERRRRVCLVVDNRGAASVEALDGAAESAANWARRHAAAGVEVGLAYAGGGIEPGLGPHHLRRLLTATAALAPATAAMSPPRAHARAEQVSIPLSPAARPRVESPLAEPLESAGARAERGKLTLRGAQRFSLYAACVVAFASVALSGELPSAVQLYFLGAATIGYFSNERAGRLLRISSLSIAGGALLLLGGLVFTRRIDVFLAAPVFAVVLCGSRLLGRRGAGDDALVMLSALLMLAGGAALTGDLAYGVSFALFAGSGTVALCLSHLRREVETVSGPESSARPGSATPALIATLTALSLTAFLGSTVVFLLFPRVSTHMLRRAAQERVSGVADRMQLGGTGLLKSDPRPVMRVNFPDGAPPSELYWTTAVYETWDGRGWDRVRSARRSPRVLGANHWIGRPGDPIAFFAEVELLAPEASLPAPGLPVTVRFPRKAGVVPPALVIDADRLIEPRGAGVELSYVIGVAPEAPPSAARIGSELPASVRRYTEPPTGLDPRVVALAAEFAGERDPAALARAIATRLGKLRYTLELPGEVEDPLSNFLFERKAGHCEFFASALTVLLRLNGVAARVAAGYYGADYVESGGYWMVRRGDAHAWTQVYVPGRGWVNFDATPEQERSGSAEGIYARMIELLDVARARWSSWVLDFDGRKQLELATALVRAFEGKAGAGSRLSPIARNGAAGVLLAGAAYLIYLLARRRRRRRRLDPAHREAVALLRAVKRRLERDGVTLPASATVEEWLRAGTSTRPAKEHALREALAAYQAIRFGGAAASAEKLRALRRAIDR